MLGCDAGPLIQSSYAPLDARPNGVDFPDNESVFDGMMFFKLPENKWYVYVNCFWEPISDKKQKEAEDPHVYTCKNCGATIKYKQQECDYCGSMISWR